MDDSLAGWLPGWTTGTTKTTRMKHVVAALLYLWFPVYLASWLNMMVLVWEFISGMSCLGALSREYSLGDLVWEFLFGTSCLGIHVLELFSGSSCLGGLPVSSCLGFLVWD